MRVFKQFIKNMAWPVGIFSCYVIVGAIAGFVGTLFGFEVMDVFFVAPLVCSACFLVGFLVWVEWDRAREKVKEENNNIVQALKDE